MSGSFLRVDIRTVDGDGLPTSTVVATSDAIDYDEITHDAFYQFMFPSSVTLPDPDASYAIVLYEEGYPYDPYDQSPAGWLYSPLDEPYEGGDRSVDDGGWAGFPGSDHFFKVFYSAPTSTTTEEHMVSLDQTKAHKMFVSTDGTMELDMRFMVSVCLDGTGTMLWADPGYIRKSEVYLFVREVLLRAPFSYVDVWTFDDTIFEGTTSGPTDSRPEYSAAIGSVYSTGDQSRLWAATEQAIGNLDPSSAVAAIIREDQVDEVLELMRQMNRIDYDSLPEIDSGYDPSTGFEGIKEFGRIMDWLIQTYAETMGREGIVMSDGLDTMKDTDPSEIAILANGVMGEGMTPVNFFAMGSTHWTDGMDEVAEATGGLVFEVGEEMGRVRESFNVLLNDRERTMFQGEYEDLVEFEDTTYIDSIELGVLMPDTTHLTFEVCFTYDGISYSSWEDVAPNNRWIVRRFILGFRYRIRAWMGNIYGGNYYDIYGYFPDMVDENGTTVRAGCRYTRYYGPSDGSYTPATDEWYYYRDEHYPSPKVFSLRYWTVSPSIRYLFTPEKTGGDISEYLLVPMRALPETSQINWGVIRGNSTDFVDAEPVIVRRMGALSDRQREVYFTPDVTQVGLATFPDQYRRVFRVNDAAGVVVMWETTDVVTVYSNGTELDPRVTRYSSLGSKGYIVFDTARGSSEVITVDIMTPGEAAYREGETCTTNDYRNYRAKNGPWVWDADVTIRVNGNIVRDGFNLSPDQGLVSFHKELDPGLVVTAEIEFSGGYRLGLEILDYDDDDLVDEPDFAFMFQTMPESDTLYLAGQTNPPEVVGEVTLTPSAPGLNDRLVVTYRFHQEQGNAESGSTIRWYRKRITEGGFTLYDDYDERNVMRTSDVPSLNPTGPFHEHDQWYVVVTPRDVNNEGVPVQSNIVVIGGTSQPYITAATISAAEGDDALTRDSDGNLKSIVQDLVADYTYVDPNLTGDQTLSDLSVVEWYRNGDGEPRVVGKTASASLVKSGDVWYFVITPYDGIMYGDPIASEDVVVTSEANTTG